MDHAADYAYYTSDIGRMWPVNGTFTTAQRTLYGFIVDYHRRLLARIGPGVDSWELMAEVREEMAPIVERTDWAAPHHRAAAQGALEFNGHLSHPVGMAVHDVGDYRSRPLEPGVVMAIDPMIWIPEERQYVRCEDTVVVTADGCEVLTSAAPLDCDEIEAAMGEDGLFDQWSAGPGRRRAAGPGALVTPRAGLLNADGTLDDDGDDLSLGLLATRRSYREGVVEVLRAALVSGQMKPGRLYSAPTLAGQLGVSATPVREAMSELAAQGMVEVVRNRGFRVRELSDVELDEITQLRQLIEVPTTAALARSCDPGAIDAIRPLAASIETAARAWRPDRLHRGRPALPSGAARAGRQPPTRRRRRPAAGQGSPVRDPRARRTRAADPLGAGARGDPRPPRRPRRRGHRAVDAPSPRPRARRVGGAGRRRRLSATLVRPPNIVVVMADDLGFGDIGCCNFGATRTPAIDSLAG